VEGSVYCLCERKSALISGRAASIFLIWMSKCPMEMVPRSLNLRRATAQSAANHQSMTPPSESLRTVFRHSGGKPQSITTGRLNFYRVSMNGAADVLASNKVSHAVASPCRSSTPGFSTSRCRKLFFSSSHLQKVDFPEAGMPEIRKCMP
jgi:hypothetical protein